MNDTPAPFANFVPSTPEPAEGGQAPKKRKGRGPAKKPAEGGREAAPNPPKAGKRISKPRTIKIDLTLAMSALSGLQDDDARFVTGVVQAMQPFGKKQRARIALAIAQIFG